MAYKETAQYSPYRTKAKSGRFNTILSSLPLPGIIKGVEMGKSLSVKEAAAILGLSEGKVKSMCVSGELAAVKFGNRWKITEEEVSRVQHGEAPSQVNEELKKIGIADIEEFIKLKEALQQAQVVQDERGEELNKSSHYTSSSN